MATNKSRVRTHGGKQALACSRSKSTAHTVGILERWKASHERGHSNLIVRTSSSLVLLPSMMRPWGFLLHKTMVPAQTKASTLIPRNNGLGRNVMVSVQRFTTFWKEYAANTSQVMRLGEALTSARLTWAGGIRRFS